MIKKISLLTVFLLIIINLCLFSATYYDAGSQRFTISAGTVFPFTITDFQSNTTKFGIGNGDSTTHLKMGGYGSILYQVFINEYVAVGGEIGYQFNYDNEAIISDVPIIAKATILPIQGAIDIPISLGMGISFLSRENSTMLTPYISTEIGLDLYLNDNWGLGLKTGLWLVPELYFLSGRNSMNSLATFIPVTLTVTYRQ